MLQQRKFLQCCSCKEDYSKAKNKSSVLQIFPHPLPPSASTPPGKYLISLKLKLLHCETLFVYLNTNDWYIFVISSFRWKIPDRRVLNSELRKLSGEAKRDLARKLLIEADNDDIVLNNNLDSYQDSDFENPFSIMPPAMLKSLDTPDGVSHDPCLKPDRFTALKLLCVKPLGEMIAEYTFSLPQASDYTGCFPGQYVRVRIGKNQRFLSPVSRAKEFGRISLLMKYETHGVFSNSIRSLQIGKNKVNLNTTKRLQI